MGRPTERFFNAVTCLAQGVLPRPNAMEEVAEYLRDLGHPEAATQFSALAASLRSAELKYLKLHTLIGVCDWECDNGARNTEALQQLVKGLAGE